MVRDSNTALRRVLLPTMANASVRTLALACGGLFALIGDMNAAPDGGRWGYLSLVKLIVSL